jgi:hypothetical protein
MAPVLIDASSKVAYTGATTNIGWNANALNVFRTAIMQLAGAGGASFGNATTTSMQAQSFTTGTAFSLAEVRLALFKTGAPTDNVSVELHADSSNKPGATILGTATNVYTGASISTTATWLSFQFATPVALSASTKYWVVVQRSGAVDASNFYTVRTNTGSAYAGGGTSINNAGIWTAESATNDFAFQIVQQAPIALYATFEDTSLNVYSSTDGGATWVEQDGAHAPAVFNSTYPFDSPDTIVGPYLVTSYFTAANTIAVRLFDMTTNLWATSVYGVTPPTSVSHERNIRVHVEPTFAASTIASLTVSFTDFADDADLAYQRVVGAAGTWGAKTSVAALTSTEASLIADVVTDKSPSGFGHQLYYDCANDDFSMRSLTGATLGTETDLTTTAAPDETKHTGAAYQVYQSATGVDTIIAAFTDASNQIRERILTLEATSASVTMATDNLVSTATTTAGRQLSTCRFSGTNYIVVNVSGTGISYYTSSTAGTWSAATAFVTGLTDCQMAQIKAIDTLGVAVLYTDNGDVKIDWIAVASSGGAVLTGTSAGTSSATATRIQESMPLTGSVAGTGTASATQIQESQPLTGSSAGLAAASATQIIESQPLTGSTAGLGTSSATNLTVTHVLTGNSAGVSAATSTVVSEAEPLTASSAGTSTASATQIREQHPLTGTSAGTSSATATGITEQQPLTGSSAGVSSATVTRVSEQQPLTGTSAGTGTATATQVQAGQPLTGSTAGTSAASATQVSEQQPLTGASAGTSTATASAIITSTSMSGNSAGTSSADASRISLEHPLTGTSAGTSAAAASILQTAQPLSGSSAGTSTADALRLSEQQPLSGSSAGMSTTDAPGLSVAHVLTGESDGTSTATATQMQTRHDLTGSSAGTSTADGTRLVVAHQLTGAADGVAAVSGSQLIVANAYFGQADGTSTASATGLQIGHALTGTAGGTSSADATSLSLRQPLTGSSAGTSSASGNVAIQIRMTGSSAGVSNATATSLNIAGGLTGQSDGVAIAQATRIVVTHRLIGESDGTSTASTTMLRVSHLMTGVSQGISGASAIRLSLVQMLTGRSDGVSTALADLYEAVPFPTGTVHLARLGVGTVDLERMLGGSVQIERSGLIGMVHLTRATDERGTLDLDALGAGAVKVTRVG